MEHLDRYEGDGIDDGFVEDVTEEERFAARLAAERELAQRDVVEGRITGCRRGLPAALEGARRGVTKWRGGGRSGYGRRRRDSAIAAARARLHAPPCWPSVCVAHQQRTDDCTNQQHNPPPTFGLCTEELDDDERRPRRRRRLEEAQAGDDEDLVGGWRAEGSSGEACAWQACSRSERGRLLGSIACSSLLCAHPPF